MSAAFDPFDSIRALYRSLLTDPSRYDEFCRILAQYDLDDDAPESLRGAWVRVALNAKLREWLGARFDGLDRAGVRLWRAILLEDRYGPGSTDRAMLS